MLFESSRNASWKRLKFGKSGTSSTSDFTRAANTSREMIPSAALPSLSVLALPVPGVEVPRVTVPGLQIGSVEVPLPGDAVVYKCRGEGLDPPGVEINRLIPARASDMGECVAFHGVRVDIHPLHSVASSRNSEMTRSN